MTKLFLACLVVLTHLFVAMLVHRAIGDKLTCVFVDNGLLRLNEGQQVMDMFGDHFGLNIVHVKAEQDS